MRRFRRTLRSRLFLLALAASAAAGGCRPGDEIPEHPGKAVYLRHCYACHHAGVAGAPKFGETNAWADRLAAGRAALTGIDISWQWYHNGTLMEDATGMSEPVGQGILHQKLSMPDFVLFFSKAVRQNPGWNAWV